jgi:hypothetical protein
MTSGVLGVVGDLQGIGEEAMPALDAIAALPGALGEPEIDGEVVRMPSSSSH